MLKLGILSPSFTILEKARTSVPYVVFTHRYLITGNCLIDITILSDSLALISFKLLAFYFFFNRCWKKGPKAEILL